MADHRFNLEDESIKVIDVHGCEGNRSIPVRRWDGPGLVITVEPGKAHTVGYCPKAASIVLIFSGTTPDKGSRAPVENFFDDKPPSDGDLIENGLLNPSATFAIEWPVAIVYVPVGGEEPTIIHH